MRASAGIAAISAHTTVYGIIDGGGLWKGGSRVVEIAKHITSPDLISDSGLRLKAPYLRCFAASRKKIGHIRNHDGRMNRFLLF